RAVNRDEEEVAAGLSRALNCIARGWAAPRTPLRIVSGVDEKTWLGLRALHEDLFRDGRQLGGTGPMAGRQRPPFPGLVCTVSTRRVYPHGSLACFVLGALGELGAADEEVLRRDGILLDNAAARSRYWDRLRNDMDDETAARLEHILRADPRDVRSLGELYSRLSRLRPSERDAVAGLGLAEPVRWSERPPRMQLAEPEMLWLGVGLPTTVAHNSLPNRSIGELGVERVWNDTLRGKSGMKIRDAFEEEDGEQLKFRRNSQPQEGQPMALTLSMAWQKAAETALKSQDKPGAIVVLDVTNGDVLALTSFPDFDPNLFSPPREGTQRQAQLRALLADPRKPLVNRAISEHYPLGSVMKTLVAAVALEKGLVTTTETLECAGHIVEGGQKFHCDDNRAHGTVDLMKAIRCSCNVYFMQIGARAGAEGLSPCARQIFGRRTGIDLPAEAPGIFPDRAWRVKAYPNNPAARVWTRGNDFLLAIGQGQLNVTVMQTTVLMAAVSNGGCVLTPRLWLDAPPPAPRSLGISPGNLAIVRHGLDEAVNVGRPGERGTAYVPFHERGPELAVRVAGKTSTAEHRKGAPPHAWFAGYAPADSPRVAFAIVLEEGGHGGAVAAPLAYAMLRDVYGTRSAPVKDPGGPGQPVAQAGDSAHVAANETRP
ncbi:MAG: penicillin-binding transpeptidase domain-containing protein, partial [Planctomycetota bacterium]|nr:penicillin-binding transpeptidase domain-containing protein [Planctomycetota bacterium]